MCKHKSWLNSCVWIGLGLLVFIALPLTIVGWRQSKLGCRGWSRRKQNAQTDESHQQKMRRMDQALRETAENLDRLSAEMRREAGPC